MGNLTVGVNITLQIFGQNIGNFISLLHSLYESTPIEKKMLWAVWQRFAKFSLKISVIIIIF
jgi:hypothetical protein